MAVADLAARGADLVVLPEMWLTGYDQSVTLCAGTIPELDGSRVYNTAVLIDADGEVLTAHRKVHLYRPGGEVEYLVTEVKLAQRLRAAR